MSARRGRPPLVAGQRSQPLTVRVPERAFDRLCDRATRDRSTLRDVVRRALDRLLDDDDDDTDD